MTEYIYRPPNYTGPLAIDTTDFFRKHKRHPNDDELAEIINNQERRLVESHLEYVKQVQLEYPEIICNCPMCEWAISQLDEVKVKDE